MTQNACMGNPMLRHDLTTQQYVKMPCDTIMILHLLLQADLADCMLGSQCAMRALSH